MIPVLQEQTYFRGEAQRNRLSRGELESCLLLQWYT